MFGDLLTDGTVTGTTTTETAEKAVFAERLMTEGPSAMPPAPADATVALPGSQVYAAATQALDEEEARLLGLPQPQPSLFECLGLQS
jgi:hypothetical protein